MYVYYRQVFVYVYYRQVFVYVYYSIAFFFSAMHSKGLKSDYKKSKPLKKSENKILFFQFIPVYGLYMATHGF